MSPQLFERYKIQIQKIITANDEAISEVVLALHEVPLILRAVPFAAKTAAKTQKISEEDALDIILVVGLLTALGEDSNLSKDEVINLISDFVENDEFFFDFSEKKNTQLRKRLVDLLDNASTLRVLYKVTKVFDDYERIFFDAKVVTDIRPVFDLDTGTGIEEIQAVTITHAIKIEYKDLEGEKRLNPHQENKAHRFKQITLPRRTNLSRVEAAQIEKTFFELANQWRRETNHMSLMSDVILHPAYQRIIGMGLYVVPLILRELSKEPDHWFWALRSITGANPVKPEDKGRLKKMAEAWLDWGRQHGYKC